MTLILTVLTQDYVIQASDRRLTFLGGPNAGRVAEDERNKAVIYAGVAAVAYTGLADIGREGQTDYWIVETVSEAAKANPNVFKVLDGLGVAATKTFAAIAQANPKVALNHAFVVAGWTKANANAPVRPYVTAISNCLDKDWRWVKTPEAHFSGQARELRDDEPFHLFTAGAQVTPEERALLERQLGRAVRENIGPDRVAHLLVSTIRGVNDRQHTKTVGRSALVVSVPRPSPQGRQGVAVTMNRTLISHGVSSVYFPGNSMVAAMYAPHNVDASGVMMRDFQAFAIVPFTRALNPPWLKGAVVLCPHINGPGGPVPQAARDHPEAIWSTFAEIDSQGRDDLARPVVAVIHFETPAFASVLSDPGLFVLVQPTDADRRAIDSWPDDTEEVPRVDGADRAALDPWLKEIGDCLVRYGVSAESAREFVDAMRGRQRGWVVIALRDWFRELAPPQQSRT